MGESGGVPFSLTFPARRFYSGGDFQPKKSV